MQPKSVKNQQPYYIDTSESDNESSEFGNDDSCDEDYKAANESESENDSDLFAENVEYGTDDEELGEEDTRDIYYNGGDDEVDSDEDEPVLNDGEDANSTYPTFNLEVDFKGKIKLTLKEIKC